MFGCIVKEGSGYRFYSPDKEILFNSMNQWKGWRDGIHPSLKPFLWTENLILLSDQTTEILEHIKKIYNLYRMIQAKMLGPDDITNFEMFIFDALFNLLYDMFGYNF